LGLSHDISVTKENISGTAAVIHHILVITRIRFVDFQRTGGAETVDGKQKSLHKPFFFVVAHKFIPVQ
jgi:hypothetical protein